MQKRKSKIKNLILSSTAVLATVVFIGSICSLDSASWMPTISCVLSLGYLSVFAYANDFFGSVKE